MKEARNSDWRRATRRLLGGVVLGAAAIVVASPPASAAATATFGLPLPWPREAQRSLTLDWPTSLARPAWQMP